MRSSAHIRQSASDRIPHRSSTWAPCRWAIDHTPAENSPAFDRVIRITGEPAGSNPVPISTAMPAARRPATASSRRPSSASMSVRGRRMSLPPPMRETRSGRSSRAAGSCSRRMASSSLPRTARLAYSSAGRPAAARRRDSVSARRSAQPRWRAGLVGSGSAMPSVNESPRATYRFQGTWCTLSIFTSGAAQCRLERHAWSGPQQRVGVDPGGQRRGERGRQPQDAEGQQRLPPAGLPEEHPHRHRHGGAERDVGGDGHGQRVLPEEDDDEVGRHDEHHRRHHHRAGVLLAGDQRRPGGEHGRDQDEPDEEEDDEPHDRAGEHVEQLALTGEHQREHGDRGDRGGLPHGQHRVTEDLAGQQRPGRDRREEDLHDPRLLLLHGVLHDHRARAEGEQHEQQPEDHRDQYPQARGRRGLEQLDRRLLGQGPHDVGGRVAQRDHPPPDRRGGIGDDGGGHVLGADQLLGRGEAVYRGETHALHLAEAGLRPAHHGHRGGLRLGVGEQPAEQDPTEGEEQGDEEGDDERLGAYLGDDLALGHHEGTVPGGDRLGPGGVGSVGGRRAARGVYGAHAASSCSSVTTSLKISLREGRSGPKASTVSVATAWLSTCWATWSSPSNTAVPPSSSSTWAPGTWRTQPASPAVLSWWRRTPWRSRSCSGVPVARIRPPAMITSWSQSRSTTSSWWEENSTGTPRSAYSDSTPSTTSTAIGSRPENGSSGMSTWGSCTRAAAICTRCWLPRDSDSRVSSARSARPRRSSSWRARWAASCRS